MIFGGRPMRGVAFFVKCKTIFCKYENFFVPLQLLSIIMDNYKLLRNN